MGEGEKTLAKHSKNFLSLTKKLTEKMIKRQKAKIRPPQGVDRHLGGDSQSLKNMFFKRFFFLKNLRNCPLPGVHAPESWSKHM